MTRQEANLLILSALEKYFKDYPDQRFTQALYNLNIVAPREVYSSPIIASNSYCNYNEDSVDTLVKVKLCQE